jgi:predicted ATPase with chaperone activity
MRKVSFCRALRFFLLWNSELFSHRTRVKSVLEVMRQPLEDKIVTISRATGTMTFAKLVAAMNSWGCHGDPKSAPAPQASLLPHPGWSPWF